MTRQLATEPGADDDRPRYEPPQVIDLAGMAQAQGGAGCTNGSANSGLCHTGIAALGSCDTGTGFVAH